MDTGGNPQDAGQHDTDNVIRFPRDWFGSKDDLIPIGSAADRLEEEAAEAEREPTSALSADDFWGEGSQALHQPIDEPRSAEERLSVVPGPQDRRPALPIFAAPSRRLPRAHMPRALRFRTSRFRAVRFRTSRFPAPRAALLFGSMVIAALALFLSGAFATSGRTPRVVNRPAASTVHANRPAPSESDQPKLLPAGQAAMGLASRSSVVKSPRAHGTRHVIHRSRRTKPVSHRVIKTHSQAAPKTSTSDPTDASADLGATPVTDDAPTPTSSDDALTNLSDSKPATTSVASSSTSSGPAGLGAVVGAQCNPKCFG